MSLEIKKIQLKDLLEFVESDFYHSLSFIPITPSRANSYINNPHGHPADVVLYMGFVKGQMVAFRTILADIAHLDSGPEKFGWCSGTWVHPEYRRVGYAENLLMEVYKDWDEKLMFTNYADASEQLYIKSGLFHVIHEYRGIRGYLSPKTRKLLSYANKSIIHKVFFSGVDFLIVGWSKFRLLFFSENLKDKYHFEKNEFPDQDCFDLLNNQNDKMLFNRKERELRWIFKYPWISKLNHVMREKYPFSVFVKDFSYATIKVFNQNQLVGFFIFSIRDRHLKTLFQLIPAELEEQVTEYLKVYCKKNSIEMLTVYNSSIAKLILKNKYPFLHVKPYGQKIYSTFDIGDAESYVFQDGDGDKIFT